MPPDMPADNWVPLGKNSMIDYKSVLKKGHEIGVKWYILKMDKFDGDVYGAVDSSLVYVRKEKLIEPCHHDIWVSKYSRLYSHCARLLPFVP